MSDAEKKYPSISDDVMRKAKSCTTHEEFMKLMEDENIELTDETMEMFSGGDSPCWFDDHCIGNCDMNCHSHCGGTCATCGKNC